ncbi:MAG: hypothetical protein AAF471_02560 [Myxococcota bacterium]
MAAKAAPVPVIPLLPLRASLTSGATSFVIPAKAGIHNFTCRVHGAAINRGSTRKTHVSGLKNSGC